MLLLIIVLTIALSWFAFQNLNRKNSLSLRPYLVNHRVQWYRLITHGFIHADSTHLWLNMFVLWQFGKGVQFQIERGQVSAFNLSDDSTFLLLYAGGLLSATIPALLKHKDNPGYASLGASGAVSAVMMTYILIWPKAKLLLFFIVPMPAIVAGILFLSYESYMNKNGRTRVAHDAHLWGALYGILFALATGDQVIPGLVETFQMIF